MWSGYNHFFAVFSFTGFILCCIPVPWHLQAWNAGTCMYMFWTGLACLNHFINAVVWNGNIVNHAPVWCDISSRILIAVSIGVPTAGLLINRRVWVMTRPGIVTMDKAERRKSALVDFCIGMGVPFVLVALYYVVQGHRYDIWEDIGCQPYLQATTLSLPLILGPPILVSVTSLVFAVLAIRGLSRRRKDLKTLLSQHSGCNTSRYIRLMALAFAEASLSTPCTVLALCINLANFHGQIPAWPGWGASHQDFKTIGQYPAAIWRSDGITRGITEWNRWLTVFCAFLFFGFFGFAEEARKNYRAAFEWVCVRVWRLCKRLRFAKKETEGKPFSAEKV